MEEISSKLIIRICETDSAMFELSTTLPKFGGTILWAVCSTDMLDGDVAARLADGDEINCILMEEEL